MGRSAIPFFQNWLEVKESDLSTSSTLVTFEGVTETIVREGNIREIGEVGNRVPASALIFYWSP